MSIFYDRISGWLSGSMGLVADSLDVLADSFVYGLALFVVGHSIQTEQLTAKVAAMVGSGAVKILRLSNN